MARSNAEKEEKCSGDYRPEGGKSQKRGCDKAAKRRWKEGVIRTESGLNDNKNSVKTPSDRSRRQVRVAKSNQVLGTSRKTDSRS